MNTQIIQTICQEDKAGIHVLKVINKISNSQTHHTTFD